MKKVAKEGIIMGAIVVAMTVAGFTFGYLPSARKIDRIREETAQVKQSLEADGQKAAIVPELLRQVEVMKGKYKDFDRQLPKRQELGGFLREITQNISQERLTNQTIEPGKPVQEDLFLTLPRFLERIDGMERLTRIQKLIVMPGAGDGALDITVQLNIYFTES